jgi:hypothetical protein
MIQVNARIYAARVSASMLLNRLYFDSESRREHEVLRHAIDDLAEKEKLNVKKVAAIPGGGAIAGVLDRPRKEILISTKFPVASQRFTFAHELGHYFLHPGEVYFRDRELEAPGNTQRSYAEIEADAFAAEFLMPRKYLNSLFYSLFGGSLNIVNPPSELMDAISNLRGPVNNCDTNLIDLPIVERAEIVARLNMYRGRFFMPLLEHFGVSKKAMAIQLLQMQLLY